MKKDLLTIDSDNDTRFKGPLGIRSMRILGWICIFLSQVSTIFGVYMAVSEFSGVNYIKELIDIVAGLSMPCFLLANFGYIIQSKEKYKKVIFNYALIAFIFILGFYFILYHYNTGLIEHFLNTTLKDKASKATELINSIMHGDLSFNIFIDLLLCSLFVYFMMGKPKKKGETKLKLFRFCSLIPLLYELFFLVINIIHKSGYITIPIYLAPLMPTKAPITFLAFILIVIFEQRRKRLYLASGGNLSSYDEYVSSNKNSFKFAKSAAIIFAICGLLDLVISTTLYSLFEVTNLEIFLDIIESGSFGDSAGMLIFAPIVLLFRYNKIHVQSKTDLIIPLVSIGAICLLYLEGFYQIIIMLINEVNNLV